MPRKWYPINPVIPARMFHYDKADKTFSAELSGLRGYPFNTMITVRNDKTNGEVTFACTRVDRDRENEWTAMHFRSQSKEHPDLKLVVFND